MGQRLVGTPPLKNMLKISSGSKSSKPLPPPPPPGHCRGAPTARSSPSRSYAARFCGLLRHEKARDTAAGHRRGSPGGQLRSKPLRFCTAASAAGRSGPLRACAARGLLSTTVCMTSLAGMTYSETARRAEHTLEPSQACAARLPSFLRDGVERGAIEECSHAEQTKAGLILSGLKGLA